MPGGRNSVKTSDTITLSGAVSLGMSAMIGASLFSLMGHVAVLAGDRFPLVFVAVPVMVFTSAYGYVRLSRVLPQGGLVLYLKTEYGYSTVSATFSMYIWFSTVLNHSLLAHTFGTYVAKLFGVDASHALVVGLGISLILVAYFVNAVGSRDLTRTEMALSLAKVAGLGLFAFAGLRVATFPPSRSTSTPPLGAVLTAMSIALLCFKDFRTLTATGHNLINPRRNIGRAIYIAIALCSVLYLGAALSVRGNLTLEQIAAAQDFALAQAAEPIFGDAGFRLMALFAVLAATGAMIGSTYSARRALRGMVRDEETAPLHWLGRFDVSDRSLAVTTAITILLTFFSDLSRVASLGAIFYLAIDLAVQWGHLRHMRSRSGANPVILMAAIVFDVVVLGGLILYRIQTDLGAVVISAVLGGVIFVYEVWYTRRHDPVGAHH